MKYILNSTPHNYIIFLLPEVWLFQNGDNLQVKPKLISNMLHSKSFIFTRVANRSDLSSEYTVGSTTYQIFNSLGLKLFRRKHFKKAKKRQSARVHTMNKIDPNMIVRLLAMSKPIVQKLHYLINIDFKKGLFCKLLMQIL